MPVRYRGKTLELSGRLVYQPVRGTFEHSIGEGTRRVELEPGLSASLRPGGPGEPPMLAVKSTLPEIVVVYGVQEEPFLGCSSRGVVNVNRLSPTWLRIQRVRGRLRPTRGPTLMRVPKWSRWPASRSSSGPSFARSTAS